jgi:hypothetical protein
MGIVISHPNHDEAVVRMGHPAFVVERSVGPGGPVQ